MSFSPDIYDGSAEIAPEDLLTCLDVFQQEVAAFLEGQKVWYHTWYKPALFDESQSRAFQLQHDGTLREPHYKERVMTSIRVGRSYVDSDSTHLELKGRGQCLEFSLSPHFAIPFPVSEWERLMQQGHPAACGDLFTDAHLRFLENLYFTHVRLSNVGPDGQPQFGVYAVAPHDLSEGLGDSVEMDDLNCRVGFYPRNLSESTVPGLPADYAPSGENDAAHRLRAYLLQACDQLFQGYLLPQLAQQEVDRKAAEESAFYAALAEEEARNRPFQGII